MDDRGSNPGRCKSCMSSTNLNHQFRCPSLLFGRQRSSSHGRKPDYGVWLTTHHHLVTRLRTSCAVSALPLHAYMLSPTSTLLLDVESSVQYCAPGAIRTEFTSTIYGVYSVTKPTIDSRLRMLSVIS